VKVLIAGGGGFIGMVIASICSSHGLDPVILDNVRRGQFGTMADSPYYEGDITDAFLVDRIFREHPDIFALFDCSGLAGALSSEGRPTVQRRGGSAGGIQFIGYVVRNGGAKLLSGPIYQIATELAVSDQPPLGHLAPRLRRTRTGPEVARANVAGGTSRCTGSAAAARSHGHQHKSAGRFTPSAE
jgi:UDP-glucose 4-epimerase